MNDGGFGLKPGLESHGGATYCAVNSLKLLEKTGSIFRKEKLINWLVHR